jgi:hypothetical protein
MSYYILPKIHNIIDVCPKDGSDHEPFPYLSHSLYNYYTDINQKITGICRDEHETASNIHEELLRLVNPYEYIFSKVPGSNFSVSKLKPNSNLFYDFLEVATTLNALDSYRIEPIKTLHITPNYRDTIECFELLREGYGDDIRCYDAITDETIKSIGDTKFHFLFLETKTTHLDAYMYSLVESLMLILRNQMVQGCCIIKISHVFYKPIIDVLFTLSSLFEKMYILKPNTSNITSFDRYVICKNFQSTEAKHKQMKLTYFRLAVFLKKLEGKRIVSLLEQEIPHYFTTKINDLNIIIGQQQLDSLNLVINLLKNKNKDERAEVMKKSSIQKSVSWCEKYKIPCNRFSEKTNIFLPVSKEADF